MLNKPLTNSLSSLTNQITITNNSIYYKPITGYCLLDLYNKCHADKTLTISVVVSGVKCMAIQHLGPWLLVFMGVSPGCRLFSTACILEWLWIYEIPEGGHCQSVLRPSKPPFILIQPVETAVPFNVVSHTWCCESKNLSLEKFRTLAGIEPVIPLSHLVE